MANKRRRVQQQPQRGPKPKPLLERLAGRGARKPPAEAKARQQQQPPPQKQHKKQQQQRETPTIPFSPADRILLVGEGDLSFAASIIRHHGCANVTATVLEKDRAELVAKYPAANANIAIILGAEAGGDRGRGQAGEDGEDGGDGKDGQDEQNGHDEHDGHDGHDGEDENDSQDEHDSQDAAAAAAASAAPLPANNKLLYGIDATKLTPALVRPPLFHRILFNFPHVGGKSTDVNRQVRHNQSLLVAFFERAAPALAPGGSLVVTLFDGEPYSLWNVRDLARHAGLAVARSFRFVPAAYPGYRHARTCGVVRGHRGAPAVAWRGEDRPARSYVFCRRGDVQPPVARRKRRRGAGSDDDDDDDDDDDS